MLKKTTAQYKISRLRKRIRIVQGGTSSSKTFTIVPLLCQYAMDNPMSEISIVAESIPHLKRGVIKDFIKVMVWTGLWKSTCFNKQDLRYTFLNGSYIEFFSADQPDKLRGARRDVLFINECNNVHFESYQQLAIRTKKFIYLDYNPTSEFWVHTELIGDPDSEFIILTYKDNEALDPAIVKEIEKARTKAYIDPTLTGGLLDSESNIKSSYWHNWWKVYGLGLQGSLEGVVFKNWSITPELPKDARLIGVGLDFGYTNDPSAGIDVYKWNDYRILDERCYKTGMVNADIANILPKGIVVYADSAEPKSIEEIRRLGITIKGVTKGADSINFGIQVMQDQKYLITSRSVNLIKEFRNYCWDTDKLGKTLNKPIDAWNHGIDAVRYHEMESIGLKKNFFVI